MDKKLLGIFALIVLIILLAGCQEEPEEEAAPDEAVADETSEAEARAQQYVELWNNQEFSKMYGSFLNQGSKDVYGSLNFVTWQEEIYDQLGVSDVNVTYTAPEEAVEYAKDAPANFDIHVEMETTAGPIEFDQTLTMLYETHAEVEDWFVEWNPTYILPKLEMGDEVQVQMTEAKRGELVDRNDNPIAVNSEAMMVGVVPQNFNTPEQKQKLARALDIEVEEIEGAMNKSWVQPGYFVPIKQVPASDQLTLDRVFSIPGTKQEPSKFRNYPYGEALAHLVGYIGPITGEQLEKLEDKGYGPNDMIGRQGLERALEERLRGKPGVRVIAHKSDGSDPVTIFENNAGEGEVVKLTIDAELQKSIFESMGGEPGAGAAVHPETGETLALVSSPAYDPNAFMKGITGSRYQELSDNPDKPLFNRFAASYSPGSAIKPVTAAIGLETGAIDPEEGVDIEGKRWQLNGSWGGFHITRLHDDVKNPVDLHKALVYSDNIYFAQKGLDIGREDLISGYKDFGFTDDIPFVLNLQPSQITNSGTFGSDGQTADTAYGQGQMLVNILHLAAMYEPFLNGGTIYEPSLFLEEDEPTVWQEGLVSDDNAELLRTAMRSAVTDGYAKSANIGEVAIAGKTGTAELKMRTEDEGKENGYFVGYNSENPEAIIAMMIEGIEDEANGSDYVAGKVAGVLRDHKE
ncbi:penicillin-binding transpeptidase domain-containing protein [Planococcus salinarum]|uniref:penicillin-binding transpeptidase domain-containing protein n=1 Tax=Planococcus salinarum TaxID=622695 RepID=UPI000E3D8F68|nr:penicillin-binding transpeptidase domain-containing protein [Planococcus salinarum]TAA71720.1 penicillin-binding transpeptidase domain-containing protein [Planococcus salinarum]